MYVCLQKPANKLKVHRNGIISNGWFHVLLAFVLNQWPVRSNLVHGIKHRSTRPLRTKFCNQYYSEFLIYFFFSFNDATFIIASSFTHESFLDSKFVSIGESGKDQFRHQFKCGSAIWPARSGTRQPRRYQHWRPWTLQGRRIRSTIQWPP